MFDLQVISIIAGIVTLASVFYGLYHAFSKGISRVQTRIEAIESSLETARRGTIKEDCYGVIAETKVIPLKAGDEFILHRINDSGMAIGYVYHNEVKVLIDLNKLLLEDH